MGFPWRVRTRKPKGAVRINSAHPLARDIAFFYYEAVGGASGTFYDAVTGLQAGTSAANSVMGSTDPLGGDTSIFCNNGSAAASTTAFANPRGVTTEVLTVFARVKPTSKPGNKTQILSYGTSDASRNSYVGIDSNGFAIGGVGTTNGMSSAADAIDHTGQWVNIGGSGDGAGGGNGICWVNGVNMGTFNSGLNAGTTVQSVAIGRDAANYYNSFTGEVAVAIGWNRVLSDAEHLALSNNPWQLLEPVNDNKWLSLPGSGSTAYTLTAAQGSFSLNGQAATLKAARLITAAQGSYALNGQAATLNATRKITAAQGSYALNGQAAGLTSTRKLTAAQGAYALNGQASTLKAGWKLTAAQGSYSLTGIAASLRYSGAASTYTLTAANGSYSLNGQAVSLRTARLLTLAQGSYALSGQAATLKATRRLTSEQGSYSLSGQAAGLLATRTVSLGYGGYTLVGQSAGLRSTRKLTATYGGYSLNGIAANLDYSGATFLASMTVTVRATGSANISARAAGSGTITVTGEH